MLIPYGPDGSPAEGLPTLYVSRLRAYGAAGFLLDEHESQRGCPRQYRKKYVEEVVPRESTDQQAYGSAIHGALYLMEEEMLAPEVALQRVWPASLGPEWWAEAVADLNKYLERGGPMNKYGTIAVEVDLYAPLYEDETFGPVWFGGAVDWLGIDVENPQTLHAVDYKTNRQPPSRADVAKDIQLKAYDYLIRANWAQWMASTRPDIVFHLDAIKWYDIELRHTEDDIEEWHAWAEAIARTILRDEVGAPVVSEGCGWCPVKGTCPAYQALPGDGLVLAEARSGLSLAQRWEWHEKAKVTIKALKDGVDEIDALVAQKVAVEGTVEIPGRRWSTVPKFENDVDVDELRRRIGDREFLTLVSVTQSAIKDWVKRQPDPDQWSGLLDAVIVTTANGTKIKSEALK